MQCETSIARQAPNDYYRRRFNDRNNSSCDNMNNNNSYGHQNRRFDNPVDQTVSTASFLKNFYQQTEYNKSIPDSEVEEFRKKHNIKILNDHDVKPITRFEDTGFPPDVLECFAKSGFTSPTPIQAQCWPIIMQGLDLIGIAITGSGKTLGFLLPAIIHLKAQPEVRNGEGPIVLILASSRELTQQIKDEAEKFCRRIRIAACYGGTSRRYQLNSFQRRVEIVVACPGRLIEFLDDQKVSVGRVTYLVLDEADRMLDKGFMPQIERIVEFIRPDRQTLFFSATWPKGLRSLALKVCSPNVVHVQVGDSYLKASPNVEQKVVVCDESEKLEKLTALLAELEKANGKELTLIFCETKRAVDQLSRELNRRGFNALCIHGDKEQSERQYVLEEFRSGRTSILVATDVASRGLDIKNVKIVINMDMPMQIEDYIHRIGRTGRANNYGIAYTFFSDKNKNLALDLIKVLEDVRQPVPDELRSFGSYRGGSGYNNRYGQKYGRNSRYNSGGQHNGGNNYSENNRFRQNRNPRQNSYGNDSNGYNSRRHDQSRQSNVQKSAPYYPC